MEDRVLFGRNHRYPRVVLPSHQAEKTTTQTSALPTVNFGDHSFLSTRHLFTLSSFSCALNFARCFAKPAHSSLSLVPSDLILFSTRKIKRAAAHSPPKARGADAKRREGRGQIWQYLGLPFTSITILDGRILDLRVSLVLLYPRCHLPTRSCLGGEHRHRTTGGRLLRPLGKGRLSITVTVDVRQAGQLDITQIAGHRPPQFRRDRFGGH